MRRSENTIFLLLIGFWSLAALSFASGPLFEGPDELEHYRYVHYIAATGMLPPPDGQVRGQYHQPPLYYLINAPLLALMDAPAPESFSMRLNPAYAYQIGATGSDNKALYLHPQSLETSAQARAVHVLRLVPLLLGIGTLYAVWRIAQRLFPQSIALRLLMTAVAAFTPQFAFLSGVINNDSLLIFLATITLHRLLIYTQTGLTACRATLLGTLCGAILLTKTNGLFFGILPLLMFAAYRSWRRYLPVCALTAFAVVGGWYARNLLAYGDLFLTQAWQTTWESDVIHSDQSILPLIWERLPYTYSSIWGRFGSGAVSVSPLVNTIRDLLVTAGALGLIIGSLRLLRLRRRRQRQWLIIAIFASSWVLTLLYLSASAWSGNQGRYLLPGISAWAALLTAGIAALTLPGTRRPLIGSLIGLLGLGLGWSAFVDFPAAYRPLPAVEPDLMLNYRYEDAAELLGVSPAVLDAHPGTIVYETLTWRALSTPARSLKTFVHSVPQDAPIDQRDSYPGTGTLLAEDWLPNNVWSERFVIQVAQDAQPQQVIPLVAGLYDETTLAALNAKLPDGRSVTPFTSRIVVHGEPHDLPDIYEARFGKSIGLTNVSISPIEEGIQLCLTWAALENGQSDVRRYVHAFAESRTLAAQRDGDPREGAYPAHYWLKGEFVDDCLTLHVAGITTVAIGWYDPVTGVRLSASAGDGASLANDQLVIDARPS